MMEFLYSVELPAAENSTGGLASDIPVRRHTSPLNEDIGAIRAQHDWRKLIGPLHRFKGGLSSRYGLMQVAVPECRPERLEILAYASELGFLYDDHTEFFNSHEVSRANADMQMTFAEGVQQGMIDSRGGGLKAMQAALFKEMVAIDAPRAQKAIAVWVEFLEEAAGREHNVRHKSFDEYMRYRVLDIGEMFWFGLVTFGMGLTVPESEMRLLRELTRPCWKVLALQNDYCSYDKELEAAQLNGATHIVNALCVLMEEHDLDLADASSLCKQHIHDSVVEYQKIVEAHRGDTTLSKDTRIYMESLLYTISGDAAWSLVTPRYNRLEKYNMLQQSMMRHGAARVIDRLQRKKRRPQQSAGPLTRAMKRSTLERVAYDSYFVAKHRKPAAVVAAVERGASTTILRVAES